jgi:hypothetical protein
MLPICRLLTGCVVFALAWSVSFVCSLRNHIQTHSLGWVCSYFSIDRPLRLQLLDSLAEAGCTHYFCGHYHRNGGGTYEAFSGRRVEVMTYIHPLAARAPSPFHIATRFRCSHSHLLDFHTSLPELILTDVASS